MYRWILCIAFLLSGCAVTAVEVQWNMEALKAVPETRPAPEFPVTAEPVVRPVFYRNEPYRGKPTEVFAWIALPPGASAGRKAPGIVIAHGGGGTAFRYWAKLWAERGYAAIAMDLTGGTPSGNGDSGECGSVPHPAGGPNLNRTFQEASLPFSEQWPYHAVAAVIRANSLLRSLPEVDPERVGLTGISWGAVISECAAGVDRRFAFAAFVYGCGFLGESSQFKETLDALPAWKAKRWLENFDPQVYAGAIRCPVLFVNGALDRHFRPDSWRKTVLLVPPEQRTLVYGIFLKHAHPPASDPAEVRRFADAVTGGGEPLPKCVAQSGSTARFDVPAGIASAEFCWTVDATAWPERKWRSRPAAVAGDTVSIPEFPAGMTAGFFRITDRRGMSSSSLPEVR